nr:MAG TPA: hypothetical protein [Caudoviricetes sp.]
MACYRHLDSGENVIVIQFKVTQFPSTKSLLF